MSADNGIYIIAEIGVNHNGDIALAKQLIDYAAEAGCDAAKFQTYKTENLVTLKADQAKYQTENIGKTETQYEMLKRLELSAEDFAEIKSYCDARGIEFLSTPFDEASCDMLEQLGVLRYKVGSGDITNKPLIEYIAATGKPLIFSTGMATFDEVSEALTWMRAAGAGEITILHCTTSYPTDYADVNMLTMLSLKEKFGCPVGYSDHTIGVEIPVMAASMGARIIEKHITLDSRMEGPDHRASLEVSDLKTMVSMIRHVELAQGSAEKVIGNTEADISRVARKSIVVTRDMQCGEILTKEDLVIKRPGTGLEPKYLSFIVGKELLRDIKQETPLTREDITL